MPSAFVNVPITTDPDDLASIAFSYLQARYPNWVSHDGQLDTMLISAAGRQVAELMDVASDVPSAIFRYFGTALFGLPPQDATNASLTAGVTVADTLGYTIPATTLVVGIRDANGVLQGFTNPNDIVIGVGTSVLAGVPFTATSTGAESSGLGGPAFGMTLISAITAVSTVIAEVTSSGGFDEEDDDAYLDRLANDLQLQAPRPIIPDDYSIFARNITGVKRALALDGYDALALTNGNSRTITVAVADANGLAVGSAIKTAVQVYLQQSRELNFNIYVIDPTYTTVDVQVDVDGWTPFNSASIQAIIAAALATYVNPAVYGRPPFGDSSSWSLLNTVKVDNLMAVVKTPEVKNVNSVLIRTGVAAYSAADVALAGAAPLPLLGAVTVTVH